MSPILGIIASSKLVVTGSYESIATTTVGAGGTSTITFSSIPSTYKHLQLRFMTNAVSTATGVLLQINSDSGANYSRHSLWGNGSSATGAGVASTASPYIQSYAADVTTTNPTVGIVDLLDYSNTNKNKTIRVLTGTDKNGSGGIEFNSMLWQNTNAITTLVVYGTASFAQNSSFALYGIKG
jgi:hypothetical protein